MTDYPLTKFSFRVDWGGARIDFTEVTGLTTEIEVIEYRDGASPTYSKMKIPGMPKFGNVTLKRGMTRHDNGFFDWWNTVALNTVERRDVVISLQNELHEPVVVYKLHNAFAAKITAPDFNASSNEVAIESIELAHDGLSIQND